MRRPPLDPAVLASLATPRVGPWLGAALVDWAIVVGIFAVVAKLDHPLAYVLAIVPLGSRQQALGALFHDAAHHLVTTRTRLNDALGNALAAFPLGLTLAGYRRYHFPHHRALGTSEDPEIHHKSTLPQWALPLRPASSLGHFLGDLVGGGTPHLLVAGGLTRPRRRTEWIPLGAFWLVVGAVSWGAHLWWVPVLWVATIATVFWSGVRLRIWTEHLGSHDTHRIDVPVWLAHAWMPHHIGLHWEHHHFPGVPFWNLPRLRAALPGPRLSLARLCAEFILAEPLASGSLGGAIDAPSAGPLSPERRDEANRRLRPLRWLLHVVAPLVVGVGLYVAFRPRLPWVLSFLPYAGRLEHVLPERLVDVAPDAAWSYALTASLALLWAPGPGAAKHRQRWAWVAVGPIFSAAYELGQQVGVVPGSYDWADLVFGVGASLLAVVCCRWPRFTASAEPTAPGAGRS
jgi:fatty acid desaturase